MKTLLRHGARIDAVDNTWGTPPLVWALTGCGRSAAPPVNRYCAAVALVPAGANVTRDMLAWDK